MDSGIGRASGGAAAPLGQRHRDRVPRRRPGAGHPAIRRRPLGSPGGVLELSETPADGVAREVLEETGIHVKVDQLTGVYKNMVRGIVTLAFRCYATGGDTHPTSEARQVAWLTVDEATRDMVEARAVRITDALSGSGPFVRVHDGTHLL